MEMKDTLLICTLISLAASLPNPEHRGVGNARANNNDCPPLSRSCPTSCYTISATGCIVCQCPTSHGSSSSASNKTQTASGSGSSGNNNGCPLFPSQCDPNCMKLDSMGCRICSCPKTSQTSTSTGTAGSAPGVNGCAPFPKNCSAECAHIDSMGCIVCSCSSGGSGHTGSSTSSSSASQGNINGCHPFPKNCRTECAMVDAQGCIVCQCPTSGSNNSSSTAVQTSSSGGNGINGCPSFPKNCDSSCVTLDDMGCVVCSCSHSSKNSSQTSVHQIGNYVNAQGQGSSGNGNGCPALDPKCPAGCTSVDSQGCVRCTCHSGSTSSSSSQSGSVSSSNAGGCRSIAKDCQLSCLNIDASGCVICSCPANSANTGTGGYGATCPPYKADDCDDVCKMTDSHGCPICDCSQHLSLSTTPSNPNSGGVPGAGGCPAFDFSKCDPSCVSMDDRGCMSCSCPAITVAPTGQSTTPGSVTSVPGAGGCPPFDFSTCDPNCVVMDGQGCMSCHCAGTTHTPSGGHSSQTPGPVTSVPGAGGCPSFDFSTCDPKCVTMDDKGCLACVCAVPIAPSGGKSNTSGSVTSVPGAGGCPAFDFSTCDPNCVVMDAQGCMSCHCTGTTHAPSGGNHTSGPVTSVPGAGGCPAFDFSTCDPNCVVMDAQGCMSCQCKSTTAAPSGGHSNNSSGSVTTVPGAGGCPSFDFSSCDPNCVVMDGQGCLSCQCKATTNAPSGGQTTTKGGVTSVPGAGGCQSFDFSTCDPSCVVMDGQGCMTCQCKSATTTAPSGGQKTTPGGVTSVPGAGGCPSFDFSTCDPNCVVMDGQGCMSCQCKSTTTAPSGGQKTTPGGVTSVPGAGGCPSFDFSTCDPSCVVMDGQGCMTCQCKSATTPASSGGQKTTPGGVTSVPGAGGCPSFDFSTCDPSCVVMDGQGCMSCQCKSTTASPSGGQKTTPGGVTSVPGAGGCPSFDFSTCDPSCVVMDGQGCMTCQCKSTTKAPSRQTTTPQPVTSAVPAAGGCPSFDFSSCNPNCVVMDAQGCLTCSCAATATAAPGSTTPSSTSVPGAGGCPAFDFNKCNPNCVTMNAQGCMTCSCATTPIPTNGNQSGKLTLAPAQPSTMQPSPSKTTLPPPTTPRPTTATPRPRTTTTLRPTTTTSAGITCPPIRCTYPCDVGVAFNPQGCPVCKCRATTASP